jgi:hypothetical protein
LSCLLPLKNMEQKLFSQNVKETWSMNDERKNINYTLNLSLVKKYLYFFIVVIHILL